MVKHLLLDKIHVYKIKEDRKSGTDGSHYCINRGFWLENSTSQPLVQNPRRPLPSSKKHDVERGEDKK